MKKKRNIILSILLLSIIVIVSSYFLINLTIDDDRFIKFKTIIKNKEHRQLIKKYFFPYKLINVQERRISEQKQFIDSIKPYMINLELAKKDSNTDIKIFESSIKLSNNKTLKKYKLNSGFYSGVLLTLPGSGYIDFHEDNIFILSSRGVLAFRKNLTTDELKFKQIKNNIDEFIGLEQFNKDRASSLKDLKIIKNKIFISYTEEITEDCWNTSIIYGDINYEKINFNRLFSPKECIHSFNNVDGEFGLHQAGGRITNFDNNHILLSVGDYYSRFLAQEKESVNGKIIKININNSSYKIVSIGHRNPQGLYFDKENNFVLETEHGPQGGDEINLIEVDKNNENELLNYGWAVVSAGEHYGGKNKANEKKYKKYPLYKSHSKYGFIEPLKSFVPSIGISEITKIGQNKYAVSSLRDKSLYFFKLNEQREIINLDRVKVFERIRDLGFNDNKLYLFMENTASIGVININEN
jgi:hypothetical protein